MEYKNFKNIKLSRLGLGNMRLPLINEKDPNSLIDYPKAHQIIDYAYKNGINYFDTAYIYNNGDSEKCLGEAMKKYPRDSFYLATKYHIHASNSDYKKVFAEQLSRLQTDHIDFYLLHCLMDNNIDDYLNSGAIEFFNEQRKLGKISYLGFSSHASTNVLEKFADANDWDFAQIQFNYYDYNYKTAKQEYEILNSRNIPIMVMEPVRGGRLSNLTDNANAILKQARPDYSIASWALRFVKSMSGVQVILSGMSNLEQVEDNIKTFSDDSILTNADLETLNKASDIFKKEIQVPCTACRYCCSDCSSKINIPEYLKYYNAYKLKGEFGLKGIEKVESQGKPSDCIECGNCTGHCPQNIDTPKIMKELAQLMKEKNL